jgi:hypothetical protein
MTSGPCDWPVSYASCGSCEALTGMEESEQAEVEAMAAEFLWHWTGKVFGLCPVTVRPCRSDCTAGRSTFYGSGPYADGSAPWGPVLIQGEWFNLRCGQCASDGCSCSGATPSLLLPGPVAEITEVLIDGAVLSPDAYRVDNSSYLVRTDGGGWPACQDLASPADSSSAGEVERAAAATPVVGTILEKGDPSDPFLQVSFEDFPWPTTYGTLSLNGLGYDNVTGPFSELPNPLTAVINFPPDPVDSSVGDLVITLAEAPGWEARIELPWFLAPGEPATAQVTDPSALPTADEDNPAANTFQITYQRGVPVPTGGQLAAGLLACEYAKALCNDSSCQLPKRVQSISRQGVTVAAVLDSFDDIDTGHTGIWLIDSWVASVTKSAPRWPSRVYNVDMVRPVGAMRRTTWPTP